MESCLAAIRTATNNDDIVKIIYNAVESPDLYTFSEILAENAVKGLLNHPELARFYHLLQLFAYGNFLDDSLSKLSVCHLWLEAFVLLGLINTGTYEQYLLEKEELPELTHAMILKLRQLTLVSMCVQHKQIPVKEAMNLLRLDSVLELQAIFIGAVYAGILQVNCANFVAWRAYTHLIFYFYSYMFFGVCSGDCVTVLCSGHVF